MPATRTIRRCAILLATTTALAVAQAHKPTYPSVDPVLHGNQRWSAVSNTAMAITGDISTSPTDIRLANHDIPLTLVHALTGDALADAAALFPVTVGNATVGALYRISVPPSLPFKNRNTLCGREATTWLVIVGSTPDLSLAFFSGPNEPDLTPAVVRNSTALCGTFGYTSAPLH